MISKKYFIYILQSKKDESYYVGYTQNVDKRLKEHNSGKSKYTKNHKPYVLVYTESYDKLAQAKQREQYIKSYKSIKTFLKSRVPPNL